MLVELDGLPEWRVGLRPIKPRERLLPCVVPLLPGPLDDRPAVDSLVDMELQGRRLETRMLGLASPHQLRIKVRGIVV